MQTVLDLVPADAAMVATRLKQSEPRTGGRMCQEERLRRLAIWSEFVNTELEARGMRPAQLALYANVNASTVSVWRHAKSLPDREAVNGVARCFRLPVVLVAEKAGMLPPPGQRVLNRMETDAEWRALLADIDRLPHNVFCDVKSALRNALQGSRRCRAS